MYLEQTVTSVVVLLLRTRQIGNHCVHTKPHNARRWLKIHCSSRETGNAQCLLPKISHIERFTPFHLLIHSFVSPVCVFQVQDTSFILCIVYVQPEIPVKQLKNLNTAPSSKLLYHRLDLLGQPNSCLHFKQLATVGRKSTKKSADLIHNAIGLGKKNYCPFVPLWSCFPEFPTVMLSAGSFSSPYEHLSQPETKRMVEHYTAYLSDNTRLIANPGLKVRNSKLL